MSYFLTSILLIIYLIMYFKVKAINTYFPLSKKGFFSLKNNLASINYAYNFKTHFFILFNLYLISFLLAYVFKLKLENSLIIYIYALAFFPIILIKYFLEKYYEFEFNNLNIYLQQLILLFKDHPKILTSLKTVLPTISDPLLTACNKAILELEKEADLKLALKEIENLYPHFILINLHQLLVNVELYGSFNYDLGLTILQDDLDDWYDSVYKFKKRQHTLIYKVYALVGFSLVISFFGIMIFKELPLSYESIMYQFGVLSLFLINLTTILITTLPIGESWISKLELL